MTTPEKIDVSIIMAAWNAERFIARAVSSALAQTEVSLEIIVIDDASTDATDRVVAEAAGDDVRLRYERLAQNSGPSAARNLALELAGGRYIAVLDADDMMAPGRLAELVDLGDRSGADIIADNMFEVPFPETEPTEALFLNLPVEPDPYEMTLATYMDPASDAQFGNGLGYLKPLFRKASLDRSGLTYDHQLRNSEDYYLVASLLAEGARMLVTSYAGYLYSVRAGSISHRLTPELTAALLAAEARFSQQYSASFDTVERKALARRGIRLRNIDTFERFVAAIKRRAPVSATRVVMGQLKAAPHVIAELVRIAGEKSGKSVARL